ncbi:hypothetical protein FDA94_28505 [Herbidospora galbida]|uniref:TROVE domain-containing protein n=1 Tax=Herbidospora galbida TaxID=2575442 RepID=A0A4V5UYE9_9ACTN|nr:hypothetical protein [Herbidospora galbida]TKK84573.1 hypothetical protein FDA94_28505 [Herbidospora galbida]
MIDIQPRGLFEPKVPGVLPPLPFAPKPVIKTSPGPAQRGWLYSQAVIIATSCLLGRSSLAPAGASRNDGFRKVVRQLAVHDPEWLTDLISWLRRENASKTAIFVAAEMAYARQRAGLTGHTAYAVATALKTPSDPAELLNHWKEVYGMKTLPRAIIRGIAARLPHLYTQDAFLHDNPTGGEFTWADVLNLTHPRVRPEDFEVGPEIRAQSLTTTQLAERAELWMILQQTLFRHVLDTQYQANVPTPISLRTIYHYRSLMRTPEIIRAAILQRRGAPNGFVTAGFTPQDMARWLPGAWTHAKWAAVVGGMTLADKLAHLAAFDEAGLEDEVAEVIAGEISDPALIAANRIGPMAVLAAARNAGSRWKPYLTTALAQSLNNVPMLPGRTLILVNMAPAMFLPTESSSRVTRADMAGAIGAIFGKRSEMATIVGLTPRSPEILWRPGDSVADIVGRFLPHGPADVAGALAAHYRGHDRVVMVTGSLDHDMLYRNPFPGNKAYRNPYAGRGVEQLPPTVPLYTSLLDPQAAIPQPSGTDLDRAADLRRVVSVWSGDIGFGLPLILENARNSRWPWLGRHAQEAGVA